MTTDKTPATLATVKHGGCVQLGASERARFDAFLRDNPFMALMAGTAWQVWQAALSAQPSPGDQGDALSLPSIVREVLAWYAGGPTIWVAWNEKGWAEEEAAKASGHYTCIGDYRDGHMEYVPNEVRAEQALIALDEWLAALAARQPVGQIVGWQHCGENHEHMVISDRTKQALKEGETERGIQKIESAYSIPLVRQPVCATVKDSLTVGGGEAVVWVSPGQLEEFLNGTSSFGSRIPARIEKGGLFDMPLYAVPPAQAVDLRQLKRFELFADEGPGLGGMSVDYEETDTGAWVRFDDVKALIDGQAVGK